MKSSLAAIRQRHEPAGDRHGFARHVKDGVEHHARFGISDTGDLSGAPRDMLGRPLHADEEMGKTRLLVIFALRRRER